MNSASFENLLQALSDAKVDFILIGGVAAVAMGSARATFDVDVVHDQSPDNLARIVTALGSHAPYPRGAPTGLPFKFDLMTLQQATNLTLTTNLGDIDLLGEVPGGVNYHDLLPDSVLIQVFGSEYRCVTLDKLIHLKRSAGRPRDFEALSELESLRDLNE
jgi:predicted nucleotidyltransferase